MAFTHQGYNLIVGGHVLDWKRVFDGSHHFFAEIVEIFFLLLAVLLICQSLVKKIKSAKDTILIWNVDVQKCK